MAKLTIAQVESNIDNKVKMEELRYQIDYKTKMDNENFKKINDFHKTVIAWMNGTDRAIAHLGQPLGPHDKAPSNPNQYDWYFNTSDLTFYMLVGATWQKLAKLSSAIDLSEYMTGQEIWDQFVNGEYGTIADLITESNGDTAQGSGFSVLSVEDLAKLYKNQQDANLNFLTDFKDNLIFKGPKSIEYHDSVLDMETLDAAVIQNGNTIVYQSLIAPYARIAQQQAFFEATTDKIVDVVYGFTAKQKAIKFECNVGSKYKWENIKKYEDNKFVDYIKFSGTAALKIDNAYSPGVPGTWTDTPMPFEIKLSDLMADKNGTAIVEMNFIAPLAVDDKIMTIEYLTTPEYNENRTKELIKDIKDELKLLAADPNITPITVSDEGATVDFHYISTDAIDTAKVGDRFYLDLKQSRADAITANESTPVRIGRQLGGTPLNIIRKLSVSQADKTNNHVRWGDIKDNFANLYMVVERTEDFGSEAVFIHKGWKDKSLGLQEFHLTTKTYTTWAEIEADKDFIVSMTATANVKIDWFGAAIFAGETFMLYNEFDNPAIQGMHGAGAMSNNAEYEARLQSNGFNLYASGGWVGSSSIDFGKFNYVGTIMKGVGIVKGASIDISTLQGKVADKGKTLVVGDTGRIIVKEGGGDSDDTRIFEFTRADARNHAFNKPKASFDGVTQTMEYKTGVNNDYAKALHNLQVIVFDDDNKRVYSSEFSTVNKFDYSVAIPVNMLKGDVMTSYDVSIMDKDLESIAATTVSIEESSAPGTKPTFKWEVYVIDRDANLSITTANSLYDEKTYDITRYNDSATGSIITNGGKREIWFSPGVFDSKFFELSDLSAMKVNQSVWTNLELGTTTPQDADLIKFFGTKTVALDGNDLTWGDIKTYYANSDFRFKLESDGINMFFKLVGLRQAPIKKTTTMTIEFDDGTTQDVIVGSV